MDLAYAMGGLGGGNSAGTGAGGGDFGFFIVMGVIFVIFYLLLIRPQQKKQKEHQKMLNELTYGDTVITTGGIHGKVAAIADNVITLEIADKVKIKVQKNFIAAVLPKGTKE
jgi:preprotein translocase subunit YajC